jgi:hypothetical protein
MASFCYVNLQIPAIWEKKNNEMIANIITDTPFFPNRSDLQVHMTPS